MQKGLRYYSARQTENTTAIIQVWFLCGFAGSNPCVKDRSVFMIPFSQPLRPQRQPGYAVGALVFFLEPHCLGEIKGKPGIVLLGLSIRRFSMAEKGRTWLPYKGFTRGFWEICSQHVLSGSEWQSWLGSCFWGAHPAPASLPTEWFGPWAHSLTKRSQKAATKPESQRPVLEVCLINPSPPWTCLYSLMPTCFPSNLTAGTSFRNYAWYLECFPLEEKTSG